MFRHKEMWTRCHQYLKVFIYTQNTFVGFADIFFTYGCLADLLRVRVDFNGASVLNIHLYSIR